LVLLGESLHFSDLIGTLRNTLAKAARQRGLRVRKFSFAIFAGR
jgi:hypothetical protein